jgi:hypothetical protein
MKPKLSSIILGLLLIIAGIFALANQMGYIQELSPTTWILVFAATSIVFFVAYFLSGIQAWGWLFPAFIFAALAGVMAITESTVPDEWIATLVVGSVALPFIIAFLLDRSRWWAWIPALILLFVALIPPLTTVMNGDLVGALIIAMIGLPFLVVYLVSPKSWWALIPGGIMLGIAVMIPLSSVKVGGETGTFGVAVMFLVWALTFGVLWLRRAQHDTDWAKYPTVPLAGVAVLMLFITTGFEYVWTIGLIIAGLVLLLSAILQRQKPSE